MNSYGYGNRASLARIRTGARKAGIEIDWPKENWLGEKEETDIM